MAHGERSHAAVEQFVFGYGSLTGVAGGGRRARLHGQRRVWGVAMDNRVDIPGYKSYRLLTDGSRPAVYVAFLDLVADADSATEGILLAVDAVRLAVLDARERNYERVDLTAAVDAAPGTVWAYRGSRAGRERLRLGLQHGNLVVDRRYLDSVRAGFAAHGLTNDPAPGALPVVELERLDLSP